MLNRKTSIILTYIFIFINVLSVNSCSLLSFNKEYSFILKADYKQYLLNSTRNRDSVLNNIINGLYDKEDISIEDFMSAFLRSANENKIELNKYYSYNADYNINIVNILTDSFNIKFNSCIEVLKNRAKNYGMKDFRIFKESKNQIYINFKDKIDKELAERLFTTNGKIEFTFLVNTETALNVMSRIDSILAGKNFERLKIKAGKDSVNADEDYDPFNKVYEEPDLTEDEFKVKHPWFYIVRPEISGDMVRWYVKDTNLSTVKEILKQNNIITVYSPFFNPVFGYSLYTDGKLKIRELFLVNNEPSLTGEFISNAEASINEETNLPSIKIKMDDYGKYKLKEITKANISNTMAIISDGVVLIAPIIRAEISGGYSQIDGLENIDIAKVLAAVFKSGALSLPLHTIKK